MLNRRQFLFTAGVAAYAAPAALTSRERVDRALAGKDVDRSPFSFWYHFLDEAKPGAAHAASTLAFHRRFHTDVIKVMSDYKFPKGAKINPYPEQIKALEIIHKEVGKSAHFLETAFNPWNVAEKMSSPKDVLKMKAEKPQQLLDLLESIAKAEADHAKRAIAAGASGIFLAIANAQPEILPPADYARFSEPFDRMMLDAVNSAPMNTLHLHGDHVYLDRFYSGWPTSVVNYSTHGTHVKMTDARAKFSAVLMGGIDEVNYRKLDKATLKSQWASARKAVGPKFILAPGCSVPNDSTDAEMLRLTEVVRS
ncbi:MAG: uroporphyrinogen decarboxylase family protein [Bryobacteraceae bacterium]